MKKQGLLGLFAVGLMLGLVGAPAQAQETGKISVFGGYSYQLNDFGNVGQGNCQLACGATGLHGYAASVTYNATKNIGIEANFSGHNGSPTLYSEAPSSSNTGYVEQSGQDIYTYTFGPKLTLPIGHFAAYTHFLVGGMHGHDGLSEVCIPATGSGPTCSGSTPSTVDLKGTGMAFKTGAGLDWNHGRWGIRILEVDYIHSTVWTNATCSSGCTQSIGLNLGANNFELATGVTFNIKK